MVPNTSVCWNKTGGGSLDKVHVPVVVRLGSSPQHCSLPWRDFPGRVWCCMKNGCRIAFFFFFGFLSRPLYHELIHKTSFISHQCETALPSPGDFWSCRIVQWNEKGLLVMWANNISNRFLPELQQPGFSVSHIFLKFCTWQTFNAEKSHALCVYIFTFLPHSFAPHGAFTLSVIHFLAVQITHIGMPAVFL